MAIESAFGMIIWAMIGAFIGARDGRFTTGLLLGLFFGPLGICILVWGWKGGLFCGAAMFGLMAYLAFQRQKVRLDSQERWQRAERLAAQAVSPANEPRYIGRLNGHNFGPITQPQLHALLVSGSITRQTPILPVDSTKWETVGDLRGF